MYHYKIHIDITSNIQPSLEYTIVRRTRVNPCHRRLNFDIETDIETV